MGLRGLRQLAWLSVVCAAAIGCSRSTPGTTAPPDTLPNDSPPPPPPRVAKVVVTPGAGTIAPGGSLALHAEARDSTGRVLLRTITWSSSDAAVATVSSSGTVSGRAAGVTFVTAQCEGQSATATVTVPIPANSNSIQHVFVLVEENTEYMNVIGSASMPYLNALAAQYGLATQYYGNTHPSIGNYFEMTAGAIITNDDAYTGVVDTDNVVRRLRAAGKTWRSYASSIPSAGYTGGNSGSYVKHHNPFAYLSDVVNDSTQRMNLVPFSQLAADMAAGKLPSYGFIVPNICEDGHNCSLPTVDQWLATNVGPLLRDPTFQRSGLLIVTFDEGTTSQNGGGHVAWVAIGPRVKRGFTASTMFQHQSTLKFTLQLLGLSNFPNDAATATSMWTFLTP